MNSYEPRPCVKDFFHHLNEDYKEHPQQALLFRIIKRIRHIFLLSQHDASGLLADLVLNDLYKHFDTDDFERLEYNKQRSAFCTLIFSSSEGFEKMKAAYSRLFPDNPAEIASHWYGEYKVKEKHSSAPAALVVNPQSPYEYFDAATRSRYYNDPLDGLRPIPDGTPLRPTATCIYHPFRHTWYEGTSPITTNGEITLEL